MADKRDLVNDANEYLDQFFYGSEVIEEGDNDKMGKGKKKVLYNDQNDMRQEMIEDLEKDDDDDEDENGKKKKKKKKKGKDDDESEDENEEDLDECKKK